MMRAKVLPPNSKGGLIINTADDIFYGHIYKYRGGHYDDDDDDIGSATGIATMVNDHGHFWACCGHLYSSETIFYKGVSNTLFRKLL